MCRFDVNYYNSKLLMIRLDRLVFFFRVSEEKTLDMLHQSMKFSY